MFEYRVYPDIIPCASVTVETSVSCPKCEKVVAEWNKGGMWTTKASITTNTTLCTGEIACNGCKEWFHLECLGLPMSFLEQFQGDYYCPSCVKEGREDSARLPGNAGT